jgi:hypothetical protein
MAIDRKNCKGSETIPVDTTVFQTSKDNAEAALVERYRSPNLPPVDPEDPEKPGPVNPDYVSCGDCPGDKDCHGEAKVEAEWTDPHKRDTTVDKKTGKPTIGKHFKFKGHVVITCNCLKSRPRL